MDSFWNNLAAQWQQTPLSLMIPFLGVALLAAILLGFVLGSGRRHAFPEDEPVTRTDGFIAAGIAIAFYLIAGWRLHEPVQMVFDECYHARTGMQLVLGQPITEWTHPPLAKLCIALCLKLTGAHFNPREGAFLPEGPFTPLAAASWRFASLLFGSGAVALQYALARSLTRNRLAAILGASLLALDGVFFVQSRIAMLNVFTVFFLLAATLGVWKFHRTDDMRWLVLVGLGLGGALSTRWTALYAFGLLGLFLLGRELPRLRRRDGVETVLRQAALLAAFVAAPLAIYLLCYLPVLRLEPGRGLGWLLEEQGRMWAYHAGMKEGHPYSSPWWSWPLLLRPTWYYFSGGPPGIDTVRGIFCIGNFILWWSFVPALGIAAWEGVRRRRDELVLTALMGLGLWLLWGVQPRNLIFAHYLLEAIPFAAIALGSLLARMLLREWSRPLALVLLVAAAGWFVYFYPLLSALSVSGEYYGKHLWLDRLWV